MFGMFSLLVDTVVITGSTVVTITIVVICTGLCETRPNEADFGYRVISEWFFPRTLALPPGTSDQFKILPHSIILHPHYRVLQLC